MKTASPAYLKWPGISASRTLIIAVDKSEFGIQRHPLEYGGRIFIPKQETHITIFGSTEGTALQQKMQRDPAVKSDIILAFENTDWSYTTSSEYRHLVRTTTEKAADDATEESIIVLIEMDGMSVFYKKLKTLNLIDRDLPVPPPHVTLYTYNCDTGIGVPSEEALQALSREHIGKPA